MTTKPPYTDCKTVRGRPGNCFPSLPFKTHHATFTAMRSSWLFSTLLSFSGRVDGSYYAPHLPLKSGRETFVSSSFRKTFIFPIFAHVQVLMTTSMDC